MGEAGLLPPDARVELIDGEIIDMAPIGPAHASVVDQLSERLRVAVAALAIVRVQNPVQLGEHAEPQPDLAVVRLSPDHYRERHPSGEDILLLVEVADTTVRYDSEVKIPLYAEHGIVEAWLLDLAGRRLICHRTPQSGRYTGVSVIEAADLDSAAIPGLPAVSVALKGLL